MKTFFFSIENPDEKEKASIENVREHIGAHFYCCLKEVQ